MSLEQLNSFSMIKNCLLFCVGMWILVPNLRAQGEGQRELSVERIWKKGEFAAKGYPGFNGMKDGQHFTRLNASQNAVSVTKHAYQNIDRVVDTLLRPSDLLFEGKQLPLDDYEFNPSETVLLIHSNTESVYRRSYLTSYYLFDLAARKLRPLTKNNSRATLATFSPDGQKVAFVSDNNLFVVDLKTGVETQVTFDGKRNEVINGTTDWVYEEEFAITQGFGWSPDGKMLAFLRFDERNVKEFQMTYYGELYPDQYVFKYPKAGEANSSVTAHVYRLDLGKTEQIDLGAYEYIPRLKWSSKQNKLVLLTLNRHQNWLKYHVFDADQGSASVFFEEQSKTYVEVDDNLLLLSDGKSIFRTSESAGYNHIYQVDFKGNVKQITFGQYDVIDFLGIDEKARWVYYTAAKTSAINKGIYAVDFSGKKQRILSPEVGYNDARFTPGMSYFVRYSSDANTPQTITLCRADGSEVRVLQDNSALKEKLQRMALPKKEFIQVPGAAGDLNAWIIKPANFDPSKQYPVYFFVYGGPGSNTVLNRFGGNDYFFHQLLAQKGYLVISVDPRGTMYRGEAHKKSTYLQLGKLETEDFIAVAKHLGTLPYVDANRIGIQGWSYGGFMASLAMTKGNGVFKTGVAVAPVTNWRYYDNIYTERFMRTPAENPDGYDQNSPIHFAKDLTGNYLLIHGSGDDNVHYQNTMEMVTALVQANKQFDLFIYPNKDHGIYGGNTRNHLFQMILDFVTEHL